jgi:predicted RNA-binding protein Jag
MAQIQKVLKDALQLDAEPVQGYCDDTERALDEVKEAVKKIQAGAAEIELAPQNNYIRKLQHELIDQHNLKSESIGDGEDRHLKIIGGTDYKLVL